MNGCGISRRTFIRRTAAGGGMLALGWPARLSWATEPAPETASLKLVYYTDIHARTEWETPEAMLLAAAAMNAHKPDLILCGGDMITDGYSSSAAMVAPRWETVAAMHDALRPAPEVILGNHDLVGVEPGDGSPPEADFRGNAREKLGLSRTYRSFDRAGYHFILLDSVEVTADPLKYRGYIDAEQLAWLRADLAAVDPDTPIIVMTHMPLASSFFQLTGGIEAPVPANRGVVNNLEVLAAFEGRRLLAVLQGHLHVNEMIRWRNTTFITGGAVCGKWWRGNWHGTSEGYGVLHLHPDRVDWEYHTYGWVARRPPGA